METVEILAGGEFANAVKSLGLTSAVCTYHYQPQPTHWREEYQVWLLSKEDFDNICAIDNNDWKDDWGWWRHAYGSNLGAVDCAYVINGEKLMGGMVFSVKSGVGIAVIAPAPKRTRTNAFTTISTPTFSSIFAMKLGLLPSAMFALARLIWHGKTT